MDSVNKILEGLNKQQIDAVKETEGYVRVIAGAGSGKTKALTSRYAYIIEGLGISSSNILCVTFTNKAAQEMKNRVKKLVGDFHDFSYITTYHGFCVRVLREDIHKIQYPKSFVIMDKEDQKTLLRQIFAELNLTQKDLTFKQVLRYIGFQKNSLEYLKFLEKDEELAANTDFEKIFNRYLFKQHKNFALDFDDLINFTLYIFNKHKDVLQKWQRRLHYIQVDEAQDSSYKQFGLVSLLAEHHKNLFVVGDPDQTIYEWRGARPEILVDFDKSYPNVKTIIMNQNYRSTPEILNMANQVIKKNQIRVDKDLFTKNPKGIKVVYFHAKNEAEESTWVVNEIKRLHEQDKVNYSKFTILYRAHHISRNIEQVLLTEQIPYAVFGGIRFFERKEIKDVLAYLRLLAFGDEMSFLRVINYPKRGLGKKFLEQISHLASSNNQSLIQFLKENYNEKPFNKKGTTDFIELLDLLEKASKKMILSDFVKYLLDKTEISKELKADGDEERLENIQELINSIIQLEKDEDEKLTLHNYLQEIALYTNRDVIQEESGRVNLMTIHTSKGLEFPYVFLCGFTEGIIPSAMSIKERKKRAIEEERRLTYVAITRAEKCFYLTESEGFNHQSGEKRYPSRFLFDIEQEMYVQKGKVNKAFQREARSHMAYENSKFEEVETYKLGDIVKHPVWELGEIINVDNNRREYQIFFVNSNKTKPLHFEYKLLELIEDKETIEKVREVSEYFAEQDDIIEHTSEKDKKHLELEPTPNSRKGFWNRLLKIK